MLGLNTGEVVKLLPFILRYGGAVALEKTFAAAHLAPFAVPPSAEAITPVWATKALCGNTPGAAIIGVKVTGGSDGTTSRRELLVTYNEAGELAGLPQHLFTKSTPRLRSRLVGCSIGKIAAEIAFYQQFRPSLPIEATETLFAGYEPGSGRCMMIFEDLVKCRGYRFLGGPQSYVDRAMAESMVRLMAGYHGALWDSPRLRGNQPWLRTTEQFQQRINAVLPFEERSYVGIERAGDAVPDELHQLGTGLWTAHMRSLALHATAPLTLAHWDMHIGNWYQTNDGQMGLSDWCMMTGQWAGDFAYALVSALTIADRRAWERDLLALYLECLREQGIESRPGADAAWLAYRQQMFHPFFYWAITLGAGALQPHMQPDRICIENLHRMSTALLDLESLAAVSVDHH